MGDPKKQRKKYQTPMHPWQKERIEEEKVMKKEYGLKNKAEIWRIGSKVKHYAQQAKALIAETGEKAESDRNALVEKLVRLGLLHPGATLDDILTLKTSNLMERRLQTLVFRKGLARSVKQARQFITHNHITVAGKKVTVPSYIVKVDEEGSIQYAENSPLTDEEHPERAVQEKAKSEQPAAPKKKKVQRKGKDQK